MAAPVNLPPQFGRYRILQPLGAGGMGAVYLAEDTVLSRKVAIKVPHFSEDDGPLVRERFLREARAAAAIDHPNLCSIHDTGEIGGIQYLVMPFIEGQPLSRLVDEEHPWTPEQAIALVKKLALALQVLHDRGLIHRDLKPSNVMVRLNGEPVIMDFGLAKLLANQSRQLTKLGSMIGTPAFMPPEQVLGTLKLLGPASDVYSLGVIFYELLTGQLPFEGPPAMVCAQILHADPEPPSARRPGLGAWLDSVCLKALAKKPEQRYISMTDFARALESAPPLAPTMYTTDPGPPLANAHPRPQATQQMPLPAAPAPAVAALICPECGKKLKVPPGVEGKKLFCPRCQANLTPLRPVLRETPPQAALPDFKVRERPTAKSLRGIRLAGVYLLVLCLTVGWVLLRPKGNSKPLDKLDDTVNEHTNSINMKFVLVGKGTFWMGSPTDEKDRDKDREEQKEVTIKADFYIGIHEVTQEQWEAVMGEGSNPSYFSHTGRVKGKVGDLFDGELKLFPVENVSWNDIQQFLEKLNQLEKMPGSGWLYRLPKESEWEYACRGGPISSRQQGKKTAPFYFTKPTFSLTSKQANFDGNFPYNDAAMGSPHLERPCKVGSYKANPLGIYDMHGNVWEWCDDLFEGGPYRAHRGGGWDLNGQCCRAAFRSRDLPDVRNHFLGFRLALVPVTEK